ncbi:hypothetical protein KQR57_22450 [Bacillus inaquosorum]|nr:hypothetical protein [Bacillus inaquosorum]
MGKESATGHPKPDGNKGTAGGTSAGNSSAGTSKSGGTGGRGTASTKQSENAPRVVMVDVPGSDQEEQPKRNAVALLVLARKEKRTKKKTAGNVDSSQLKMLLLTTSTIVASRPGMEDFALSPEEAEQICTPLANIMAKSEGVAGVASEYADHIALLIACFTIFIPKFIMWKSKQPKKKEVTKMSYQNENYQNSQQNEEKKERLKQLIKGLMDKLGTR